MTEFRKRRLGMNGLRLKRLSSKTSLVLDSLVGIRSGNKLSDLVSSLAQVKRRISSTSPTMDSNTLKRCGPTHKSDSALKSEKMMVNLNSCDS